MTNHASPDTSFMSVRKYMDAIARSDDFVPASEKRSLILDDKGEPEISAANLRVLWSMSDQMDHAGILAFLDGLQPHQVPQWRTLAKEKRHLAFYNELDLIGSTFFNPLMECISASGQACRVVRDRWDALFPLDMEDTVALLADETVYKSTVPQSLTGSLLNDMLGSHRQFLGMLARVGDIFTLCDESFQYSPTSPSVSLFHCLLDNHNTMGQFFHALVSLDGPGKPHCTFLLDGIFSSTSLDGMPWISTLMSVKCQNDSGYRATLEEEGRKALQAPYVNITVIKQCLLQGVISKDLFQSFLQCHFECLNTSRGDFLQALMASYRVGDSFEGLYKKIDRHYMPLSQPLVLHGRQASWLEPLVMLGQFFPTPNNQDDLVAATIYALNQGVDPAAQLEWSRPIKDISFHIHRVFEFASVHTSALDLVNGRHEGYDATLSAGPILASTMNAFHAKKMAESAMDDIFQEKPSAAHP